MDKSKLDNLLRKINFDEHYLEATFQFKLLMQLGKICDEDKILPERHIKAYCLKAENYTKKEIDIVIEQENNMNIAIELKMPMNGQVPEQMYKFIEDIKFLEELSVSKRFNKCYLIVVTNDKNFWKGNKNDGIYSYFRNHNILKGKIFKPTGEAEIKAKNYYELSGEYKIQWNNLAKNFRYFVIEIECSAIRQENIEADSNPVQDYIPEHQEEIDIEISSVKRSVTMDKFMRGKEFELNYKKYYLELYEKNEVKIYEFIDGEKKHLFGQQKPIIIKKLAEIIENDVTNGFSNEVKEYVYAYQKGLDKSARVNTRNLGRILFDYLNLSTNHRS